MWGRDSNHGNLFGTFSKLQQCKSKQGPSGTHPLTPWQLSWILPKYSKFELGRDLSSLKGYAIFKKDVCKTWVGNVWKSYLSLMMSDKHL